MRFKVTLYTPTFPIAGEVTCDCDELDPDHHPARHVGDHLSAADHARRPFYLDGKPAGMGGADRPIGIMPAAVYAFDAEQITDED